MSDTRPVIVWFREDLRLADNPALRAAVDTGRPVICLYILDDNNSHGWAPGAAAQWWLHHSLASLGADVTKAGSALVLKCGVPARVFADLVSTVKPAAVYWNRRYAHFQIETDTALKKALSEQHAIEVHSFNGRLLFEPWEVKNKAGGPYRVFTPMWKAIQQMAVREPLPAVRRIKPWSGDLPSDPLESWRLLPRQPDWATGFSPLWQPGERGAARRLQQFLENAVRSYKEDRNRPDLRGTSGLSPHLQSGDISPVQIWAATQTALASENIPLQGAQTFLSEIAWREFSYSLLYHNPQMLNTELMPKFTKFPWTHDEKMLAAWKRGDTGYPIVDAGMRQLWQTGWMHNRVRMIVGSFLVKHLLIDWRAGMRWFWDTLVDADIASNTASWQWIAGCGADAAPYFRIFNPMTQGGKFDPEGNYVRTYVEDLQELPSRWVHQPWDASPMELQQANVSLGNNYPNPVIDHSVARQRALDAYAKLK